MTRDRVDRTMAGWYAAAALFWFEAWGLAWGLMGLLATLDEPAYALWWFAVLGGPAAVSALLWFIAKARPRAAWLGFLVMGIVGLAVIPLAGRFDVLATALIAFWTGWPGIALVTSARGVLRRGPPYPPLGWHP